MPAKKKAPSTGHIHMHAFAQFKTPHSLSMKKLLGAHVEKCYGSPEQNDAYIRKNGDIIAEEGEMRRNYNWTIKGIKEMKKEEREELPPQLYNIVQKINAQEDADITPEEIYKNVDVEWHWGESGAGKTKTKPSLWKGKKQKGICPNMKMVSGMELVMLRLLFMMTGETII